MKSVNVFLLLLLVAGTLSACNDHDADDRGSAAKATGGCEIEFAKGLGVTIPEVISVADTSAKNDALTYYAGLGKKGQDKIINAVYKRAQKTFGCEATSAGTTCIKYTRVSLGIGHLSKLKRDLLIVHAERSCRVK